MTKNSNQGGGVEKLLTFMVALSRLEAIFEAWKSNFRGLSWTFGPKYENSGSRLAKEWHVEIAPPCEAHRATSKDVRATVHSSESNMGLRKMHERGQTQSACLAAACRQSRSGLEAGRKQVFSGSDGGLGRGIWTGLWWVMPFTDAFTGFSTSSALTLWNHVGLLSEHSKPLPAWCALPLLLYSTQQLHLFTSHNSCGHSPAFSMRTSSWVACARSCQPCSCGRCFIQSWQHGRSGCQEIKSSRVETERGSSAHWAGAVKMVLLIL